MITMLVAYMLVVLGTGQPIRQFETVEACVAASYHISFVTGQETRCQPIYRSVSR